MASALAESNTGVYRNSESYQWGNGLTAFLMMDGIYQGKMEEKSIKIGKQQVQRYTGINEYCI